jgi:uncharacterized membrane protein
MPMPNPYSLTPVKPQEPGRLFVLAFADELSAFSLREILCQLEEEGVIEVGDAVVATRNDRGKVRLHQSLPLVAAGSALGSFSGMLLGMLLLNPLFGIIAGAAAGAAAAATFGDAGIDDKFMKSLGETLTPGSSALFVVVRKSDPKQIELLLGRLKPFAGRCKVLECNMPAENEVLLRNLLEGEVSRQRSAPASTTNSDFQTNS